MFVSVTSTLRLLESQWNAGVDTSTAFEAFIGGEYEALQKAFSFYQR